MKIKKSLAISLFVFVLIIFSVAFYDLYLYNSYVVNRYLRNTTPNSQIQVVVVTIPLGAGSDPRIGFEPALISIVIGVNNTVVWVNRDSTWHTAHSNIPEFYSNYIQPGGNFTHTFQDPGIYPYHCDPHPWMTGRITVHSAETSIGSAQVVPFFSETRVMHFACVACKVPSKLRVVVANETAKSSLNAAGLQILFWSGVSLSQL